MLLYSSSLLCEATRYDPPPPSQISYLRLLHRRGVDFVVIPTSPPVPDPFFSFFTAFKSFVLSHLKKDNATTTSVGSNATTMAAAEEEVAAAKSEEAAAVMAAVYETRTDNNIIVYVFNLLSLSSISLLSLSIYLLLSLLYYLFSLCFGGGVWI